MTVLTPNHVGGVTAGVCEGFGGGEEPHAAGPARAGFPDEQVQPGLYC